MTKEKISSMIDHTLLNPFTGIQSIEKLCSQAKKYNFASVCVNPSFVNVAKENLKDSKVKVCTVVGFPLGAIPSENKAFETTLAIQNGADEIDMVINLNSAFDKDFDFVKDALEREKRKKKNALIIDAIEFYDDKHIV